MIRGSFLMQSKRACFCTKPIQKAQASPIIPPLTAKKIPSFCPGAIKSRNLPLDKRRIKRYNEKGYYILFTGRRKKKV